MIGLVFISSCKKDPDLNMPTMENAVLPLIKKDLTGDYSVSSSDPAAFHGKLNVSLFWPDQPQSLDIMVIYGSIVKVNGVDQLVFHRDSAGVVEANITTFPLNIDVTWAKLAAATKKDLAKVVPGNAFKIYPRYTLASGRVVDGNDPNYSSYAQSLLNVPGVSAYVTYSVVCPLNFDDFVGLYDMSDGDPADDCVVEVVKDPAKTYGFILKDFYSGTGITEPAYDLYFEYDPFTFVLAFTPAKQKITDNLWGYANGYLSSLAGDLLTCTTQIKFKANLTVDAGSFGVQNYLLTHQ